MLARISVIFSSHSSIQPEQRLRKPSLHALLYFLGIAFFDKRAKSGDQIIKFLVIHTPPAHAKKALFLIAKHRAHSNCEKRHLRVTGVAYFRDANRNAFANSVPAWKCSLFHNEMCRMSE